MTARGFIQDKLEIKFLILYLAARVIEPVPFDTLKRRAKYAASFAMDILR